MSQLSSFNQVVRLSPQINESQFVLYLTLAWHWTQDRPWAFAHSGGNLNLESYLEKAGHRDNRNFGVFVDDGMISLITLEKEPGDIFLQHVTSPPKSHLPTIVDATYFVGWMAFHQLDASRIYTMSPIFKGRHRHLGSHRLCEACGLRVTGHQEMDDQGNLWIEYAMTRRDWLENHYGQEERRDETAVTAAATATTTAV